MEPTIGPAVPAPATEKASPGGGGRGGKGGGKRVGKRRERAETPGWRTTERERAAEARRPELGVPTQVKNEYSKNLFLSAYSSAYGDLLLTGVERARPLRLWAPFGALWSLLAYSGDSVSSVAFTMVSSVVSWSITSIPDTTLPNTA